MKKITGLFKTSCSNRTFASKLKKPRFYRNVLIMSLFLWKKRFKFIIFQISKCGSSIFWNIDFFSWKLSYTFSYQTDQQRNGKNLFKLISWLQKRFSNAAFARHPWPKGCRFDQVTTKVLLNLCFHWFDGIFLHDTATIKGNWISFSFKKNKTPC